MGNELNDIDELANLMNADAEDAICSITQFGRAVGIHLVVATQLPDIITKLTKANIPSRISFAVASAKESESVLNTAGAEKLIGNGDMLYFPVDANTPIRIQGCFVSTEEISRVVNFVKRYNCEEEGDQP